MGRLINSIYKYRRYNIDSENAARVLDKNSPQNIMRIPNIKYCNDSKRNLIDVYRPKDTLRTLPAILYIHGGELIAGNKDVDIRFCANLASCGFVVFSMEYQRIPMVNAYTQINEVTKAMNFIYENATTFGADVKSTYLIGNESGAFLAIYAMAVRNKRISKALKISPSKLHICAAAFISGMFYISKYNKIGLFLAKSAFGKGYKKSEAARYLDPGCSAVVKSLPPCYFVTGESDDLLQHTESMLKAFEISGTDYRVAIYENNKERMRSFPVLNPDDNESKNVVKYITAFFKKHKIGCELHARCG